MFDFSHSSDCSLPLLCKPIRAPQASDDGDRIICMDYPPYQCWEVRYKIYDTACYIDIYENTIGIYEENEC